MPELGEIVEPVGIDDHRIGQRFVGLVMIDDDGVESRALRLRERLQARRAAIHGDEKPRAALGERADRLDVRPVSLEDAVGNVDQRVEPAAAQETREQRRRGRAVDVVVAEDGDLLAALDGIGDAARRCRHVSEHIGVRHQPLQRRIEIGGDRVRLDLAPGNDAGEQLRHAVALHDRERPRIAAVVQPIAPGAPRHGALDAEKMAVQMDGSHVRCLQRADADGTFATICDYSRGIERQWGGRGVIHCPYDEPNLREGQNHGSSAEPSGDGAYESANSYVCTNSH